MMKPGFDQEAFNNKYHKEVVYYRAVLESKSGGMAPDQFLETYGDFTSYLTRLDKMKLYAKSSWFTVGDFDTIMILFSLSVLIVILSAINFINLKTAQASQRAKEVGVRKAIGSTRALLIGQFLMETFIICTLSYVLSLALTELLLPSFNKFYNKEIKFDDWNVFFYSFLMVVVVTLISGLVPAFYLSNFKAIETLKGNFSRSKHGVWLRNTILTLQLIISSFFIIGSLIVNSQVKHMMSKDLGYNGKQIMTINFFEYPEKPWQKYERLKTELRKIPEVVDVSYGEAVAGSMRASASNVDYQKQSIQVNHGSMDYNYLQFMGVKLLKGRWLDPKLASDTIGNMIVNEAFLRKFGWTEKEAFERVLHPGFDYETDYRIVGIVKDFNLRSLKYDVDPYAFFHYKATSWKRYSIYHVQVKLSPDNIDKTVKNIQKYWETKVEPGYPFNYYFIDQRFAKTFEKYQKQQTLFNILNVMVLIVALLGLFALSSLMIDQKLKNVAIRKTLGASDSTLVFGLTKQFLIITTIAVFISFPISYYLMNEWLKDFAYRIDMPIYPYVLSLTLLLILTFLVVSVKAYKATKVNLVRYLKYE